MQPLIVKGYKPTGGSHPEVVDALFGEMQASPGGLHEMEGNAIAALKDSVR